MRSGRAALASALPSCHHAPGPRYQAETMSRVRSYSVHVEGAKYGIGFGSALAMVISYNYNHSVIWAIIHGLLSWIYVVYAVLFH
jgi:hypothetical protein